jgi:hypothetical protein
MIKLASAMLVAVQLCACASASEPGATLPSFVTVGEGEFVQRRTTFSSGVENVVVASDPRFSNDICWSQSRTWFIRPGKELASESEPEPDEITLFPDVDASNCSRSGVSGRQGIRATEPALADASATYRVLDSLLRPARPLAPLCLDARGIAPDVDTSTFFVTDLYGEGGDDVTFELMSDQHASVSFSVDVTKQGADWTPGQVTCSVNWTQ